MGASQTRVWRPDILGDGFWTTTLPVDADALGPARGTLVAYRPLGPPSEAIGRGWFDVLYLHGWSDYFFQRHLAEYWHAQGANFYAVDLRRHGRSLGDGEPAGAVTDLDVYDAEIERARERIGQLASDLPLVMMGHSTGGLVTILWAHRNPGRASAIVLNSPWLEFQASRAVRTALTPLVTLGARRSNPRPIPKIGFGFYTHSTSAHFDGEWDFDLRWRPELAFPIQPGWLRAVFDGHRLVADGLSVDAPVLVLLSARSELSTRWHDDMMRTDSVINVDIVARRAVSIGSNVSVVRLDGALHDVFLSAHPVRDHAAAEITRWLHGYAFGAG